MRNRSFKNHTYFSSKLFEIKKNKEAFAICFQSLVFQVPTDYMKTISRQCYVILVYLPCRNWGVSNENIDKIGRFYYFMETIKGVLNCNEIGRNSRPGFDNPL